ncbi:hypothetical protein FHP05_08585 [Cerasibacillus terrae]|uniref:Uncharacterized protein n=1 Tax=Cerasibacillus terrae TaxID=2498845 RepID=A0A5C8NSZ9_9BACI|nr:hypothetical protein FHP05_08585 [Cerasibacillus terrae]
MSVSRGISVFQHIYQNFNLCRINRLMCVSRKWNNYFYKKTGKKSFISLVIYRLFWDYITIKEEW